MIILYTNLVYNLADYLLHEPDEYVHNESETEGLAWAYICDTISISFPANDVWKKTEIGRARSFIQKIYPDGRVDVTLFEYDKGYSLMILTTGRNLRETETIAKVLKEKYYS